MAVYYKEKPEFLREAMNSMWNQTVPPDDFVLVCDGPLGEGLDAVISEMRLAHTDRLNVVRLETNRGLGNALNCGIKQCRNELVARMDSDDISRPERCKKQLEVFLKYPELSICSGTVEEFSDSINIIDARRVAPETQEEILKFAKSRNPFNHPCVMFRRSAVEAAGGYKDIYALEDYYLWIRMLLDGDQGYNLQEPLLWMRAGGDMYRRRAGVRYIRSQKQLFKYMLDKRFITGKEYCLSVALRTASSIAPNWMRKLAFSKVLRK